MDNGTAEIKLSQSRVCDACGKTCPVIHIEYPEIYDGWTEYVCTNCRRRVGRWSRKIMRANEHENPMLRFKENE